MEKIQDVRPEQRGQTVYPITPLRIPNTPDGLIRLGGEKIGMSSGKELASKERRVVSREENTKERNILKHIL